MKYLIAGFLLGSSLLMGLAPVKESMRIYQVGEWVEQKEPVPIIFVKADTLSVLPTIPHVIDTINYTATQRECLALNIYHEARNQSIKGQIAVGLVTLNRVKSDLYPDTICDVVTQAQYNNGVIVPHKCQFSWWCDTLSDTPKNKPVWKKVQHLANTILNKYGKEINDITKGSLWYHATYVKPEWVTMFRKTVKVDDHIFYAPK